MHLKLSCLTGLKQNKTTLTSLFHFTLPNTATLFLKAVYPNDKIGITKSKQIILEIILSKLFQHVWGSSLIQSRLELSKLQANYSATKHSHHMIPYKWSKLEALEELIR